MSLLVKVSPKKEKIVLSFFKMLRRASNDGARAAKVAQLFQSIIGRPLSPGEIRSLRRFHDEMNFESSVNQHQIAIDYLYFLMNDQRNYPWRKPTAITETDKEILIENAARAAQCGTLIGLDEYDIELMTELSR